MKTTRKEVKLTHSDKNSEITKAMPSEVTLMAPYAFYDDDGLAQSWLAGSVIEDKEVIEMLIKRGALRISDVIY